MQPARVFMDTWLFLAGAATPMPWRTPPEAYIKLGDLQGATVQFEVTVVNDPSAGALSLNLEHTVLSQRSASPDDQWEAMASPITLLLRGSNAVSFSFGVDGALTNKSPTGLMRVVASWTATSGWIAIRLRGYLAVT